MDRLSIELKRGAWSPQIQKIIVRAERNRVLMFMGDKTAAFNTPTAYKYGFMLVKKAGSALPGEFVIMKINGEDLELLPDQAIKVGGAILRKAEDVDDYQLRIKNHGTG